MRSTLVSIASIVGLAAAAAQPQSGHFESDYANDGLDAYPSTCTVPTLTYGGDIATITQTYTSTYCPACEEVCTTYTTEYEAFCPTGLTKNQYTVTETCAPDGCRTGVPPGFTTTVDVCTVCGETPVTATLTQPCTEGEYATVVQNYPTVYQTFGPTGLVPATYTVTASCAATPCPAPVNNAPAQGFGTTVETCTTCGATPVTATLTVPTAASNVAATPVAPASGNSDTGSSGSSDSSNVSPATYTGAASSNNAGSYLAAGLAGVAAVAQLL